MARILVLVVVATLVTGTGSVAGQNTGPPATIVEPSLGQRVEFEITGRDVANNVAFWVGNGERRWLVVLARDTRTGHQRQAGQPSAHDIEPLLIGRRTLISGTVERLPRAEQMLGWRLTQNERAALRAQRVYIRADRMRTE